ncbi:MAG: hypothetical protein ABIF82_10425, partial [Planctomycetota bacterium]
GGEGEEWGYAIDFDGSDSVFATGSTESAGWCAGGFQLKSNTKKAEDAFVVNLAAADGAHNWSSYMGGKAEDRGAGIVVNNANAVLVTGWTESSKWKPALAGGWDSTLGGVQDGFVVKINDTDGRDLAASFDEAKSKFPAVVVGGTDVLKKVIGLCRNEGNLPATGTAWFSLYASDDPYLDKPGDWLLATVRTKIKLKKPGKPMKVQFKKVPCTALAAGPYYLLMECDVLADIAEFNENNNVAHTNTTIAWT